MLRTILWALMTGGVTAAVWIGIVLLSRQHRSAAEHRELLEDRQRTLDEFEALGDRLTEVEDRLAFAERLLATEREPARLPPPGGTAGV